MNKTLVTLGIGIWGVMLILRFIFSLSLSSFMNCDQLNGALLPLTVIEIVAFVIAIFGILRSD